MARAAACIFAKLFMNDFFITFLLQNVSEIWYSKNILSFRKKYKKHSLKIIILLF